MAVRKKLLFIWLLFLPVLGFSVVQESVIICGIAKDIQPYIFNTIQEIERLASNFAEYRVIIYENNSADGTKQSLASWAYRNPSVTVISENLTQEQLREGERSFDPRGNPPRFSAIAKARNRVLEVIKTEAFDAFTYVVMADLDFSGSWPVESIVETIDVYGVEDWDCVCANGHTYSGTYYDRFAFRDKHFPFGPEILASWSDEIHLQKISFSGEDWIPVHSAFGGIAIYKKHSLIVGTYSSYVTEEVRKDYHNLALTVDPLNKYIQEYCMSTNSSVQEPLVFRACCDLEPYPICCEHVAIHSSMRLQGHGKIFINPKMKIRYPYP